MTLAGITSALRIPRWSRTRLRALDPYTIFLIVLCGALIVMAVIGPLVAPYAPESTDLLAANQGPSPAHLLGTDSLGRDLLSRILWGAQISYAAALLIVCISVIIGTFLALLASWYGGFVDSATSSVLNVFIAIPGMIVAIIAVTVLGAGFWAPVLAMAFASSPYVARVIRGTALQERHRPYVEALALSGVSTVRINAHILRGVMPIVLAQATFGFSVALLEFGALSFVGLGVQPPTAEWGAMVIAGRTELLAGNPQQTTAAGVMIVLTVISFTLLGERLQRMLGASR
ncbi:ABC transporter permease [Microbacterium sp. LWO14-1.2]|uniref:ABC transporter permease n=1 Tax=unclassified Microbacterium TaxID=2609290 RepID=UPI003139C256